jgi:hypothetical protein
MTHSSFSPEYVENVRAELESRGWQFDESGPDCVDEPSAAGADIIALYRGILSEVARCDVVNTPADVKLAVGKARAALEGSPSPPVAAKLPERMWINQPSTHQAHHALNGTNVLAVHEYDDTYRVYFLSGPIVSQQMSRLALSKGWV